MKLRGSERLNFVCQLRLTPFALHEAIIDSDVDLDIATFGLSEEVSENWRHRIGLLRSAMATT